MTRTAWPEWGVGGFPKTWERAQHCLEAPRSLNPRTKTTSGPENPKLDTDLGEKRMTATNLTTRPELRGEGGGSDQGDRTNPETWQTRSLYTWQRRNPHAFSPLKKSQRTKAMTEPAKETPETGLG